MDTIRIQLKLAGGLLSSYKPEEKRCPDDLLAADLKSRKEAHKNGMGMDTPIRIEQGALEALAGLEGKDTRESPILGWMSDDTVGRVFKMSEKTGYSLKSEAETLSKRFAEKGSRIWVFRLSRFSPPVVSKQAGLVEDAEYEGGDVVAWLILWDLDSARAVCAAPFQAHSSKQITYKEQGARKQTLEEALQDDLADVLKEEATKARNRMTAVYKLGAKLLEL